jgi:ethanolamine-phosphate cytidylyltransferase/choline-phosphate cytidylyltransferase
MTRVYTDMVADLFHYGHADFLRRASELGDSLIVGVHSDETVRSYKRRPVMTEEERILVVQACRWVHEVVPDAPLEVTRGWLARHRIDLVVHGDDLDQEQLTLMYRVPQELGILRTIPHTPGISTTEILRRIERGFRAP